MVHNNSSGASIPEAALAWLDAGFQVVPVRENKSTPNGWTDREPYTRAEVESMYSTGQFTRLGVAVGGEDKSGRNLCLIEIDVHELWDSGKQAEAGQRAVEIFQMLDAAVRDKMGAYAWDKAVQGYKEITGRAGVHILVCTNSIVSEQFRVKFEDGSAIETHNGYCAVAPTQGYQAAGTPDSVGVLSADRVKRVFEIAATLPGVVVRDEAKTVKPNTAAQKQPDFDPSVPSLAAWTHDPGYRSKRPWSEILEDWTEFDGVTSSDIKPGTDPAGYTAWLRPGATSNPAVRSAVTYDGPEGGGWMCLYSSGLDELDPGTYTKPAVWKALNGTKLWDEDLDDGYREDEYLDSVAEAIAASAEPAPEVVVSPAPAPSIPLLAVPPVAPSPAAAEDDDEEGGFYAPPAAEPTAPTAGPAPAAAPAAAPANAPFVPAGKSDAVLARGIASRPQGKLVYGRDTGAYYAPAPDGFVWQEHPVDLVIKAAADAMPSPDKFREAQKQKGTASSQEEIDADDDALKVFKLAKARMNSADGRGAVKRLLGAEMWNDGVDVAGLDSEPHILWAGVWPWNLRTGTPEPKENYATPKSRVHLKTCPVAPQDGPAPVFGLLTAAMWPDEETRRYALREIAGRVLWGAQLKENVVLDSPSNGLKSTFTSQLVKILGSYAVALSPSVLLGEDNSSDAADAKRGLVGARYVLLDEPPRANRQNVSAFKEVFSGSGTMTVGGKWKSSLTFTKRFNAIVCENADNRLRFDDTAVANRVLFIPCDASTDATKLAYKLVDSGAMEAEYPAILYMLIQECAAYHRGERYPEPHSVAMERERVYGEASTFTEWVLEHYELPDPAPSAVSWTVSATDLMQGYNSFAISCRLPAVSLANVREALDKAGIPVERTRRSRTSTPLQPKPMAQVSYPRGA